MSGYAARHSQTALPGALAGVADRLDPWPDSPPAPGRLRELRTVATLSTPT